MIKKIKLEKYHYVALVGWIAKIFTVIFSFINTRLLIDLIGVDGFAIYSIIFSLYGWLALLNFALPSAVQNTISKFKVEDKCIKELLQTVLFVVIVILFLSIPVIILISNVIYTYFLSKYQSILDLNYLVIMVFLVFLFGLSTIFNKVLFALHKGYLPNIYPAFTAFFSFILLLYIQYSNIRNTNIVLTLFLVPYLFIFIISYIQSTGWIKPKFDKNIYLSIYSLAKKFFLFAILATLVLNVDYLIMARIIEAKEIAIYNLDMRVFNLILFMYSTILAALWPISSELFNRKEFDTIISNMKKNISIGLLLTLILSIMILIYKNEIFTLISGKEELNISLITGILTSFYIIIRIWTDSFSMVLQSMNEVKILIYAVPLQAMISISAQYFLGLKYGINGIIIGLILSFLLTVVWILPLKFYKLAKVG